MAQKLYVGNLSYTTTDESLRDTFAEMGGVLSATVIKDKMSGRSRGFGFVEMDSDDAAQKAIETFNGKEIEGRKLVVNEAQPMTARPRGGGGGGGYNRDRGGDRGGYGGGGGRDSY
jgi:RNA recognition motif-containing protein